MSRSRREFTDADVAVAQALTAPAVAAVRNAAHYAEALDRLEEIQALQRVVSETLSSPALETALRAVVREPARDQVLLDGSYSSAESRTRVPSYPPATRTVPLRRSVAVAPRRGVLMLANDDHERVEGLKRSTERQ